MIRPALSGVQLIKVPVGDLKRALRWWGDVYGATPVMEFPNPDGTLHCVHLDIPGLDCRVSLEPAPDQARGIAGFNLVDFAVPSRADLEAWLTHLTRVGVQHSGLFLGTTGWATRFLDPDGIQHQLYTREHHHQDLEGLPGRGRPTA